MPSGDSPSETTWSTKSAPRPTCSMPITETAWSRWSTQRESVGASGSMKNRIAITPSTPPRSASASSCQSARFLGWSKTARQPACVTENGTPSSMTSRQVCSDACARSRTTPSSANRRTSVRPRSLSPCSGVSMPPANSFGKFQVRLAERTPRSHQSSNAAGSPSSPSTPSIESMSRSRGSSRSALVRTGETRSAFSSRSRRNSASCARSRSRGCAYSFSAAYSGQIWIPTPPASSRGSQYRSKRRSSPVRRTRSPNLPSSRERTSSSSRSL